jgi:putative colanic acid biosynthesis acetyltransferase WcaF
MRADLFFLSAVRGRVVQGGAVREFGRGGGCGVVIKPRVNIHMPGSFAGDIAGSAKSLHLNFEPVDVGAHACLSHGRLSHGNHDAASVLPTERRSASAGRLVGAQAFVGPGVTMGDEAVLTAGSVATRDLPAGQVCGGNPAQALRPRRGPAI